MSIFYCAKCKTVDENFTANQHTRILWSNSRDGHGAGVYHIECPTCGYVLSGFMNLPNVPLEYVIGIIDMYSCGDGSMLVNHDRLEDELKKINNKHK